MIIASVTDCSFELCVQVGIYAQILVDYSVFHNDNDQLLRWLNYFDTRLYVNFASSAATAEEVLKVLDAGVERVCLPFGSNILNELIEKYKVDQRRLWSQHNSHLMSMDFTATILESIDELEDAHDSLSNVVVPIDSSSNFELLISLFLLQLRTDRPDLLFPTIVADARNFALGLVYSSKETIRRAIQTQKGVYFSRSRQMVWEKGAESGATQKLLRIEVDCDNDALKFIVDQKEPGFCHENRASCFGHSQGLKRLEETIKLRLENNNDDSSYTSKLFQSDKLLEGKIIEEAGELVDAKTRDEVIWEAADLIYFTMVKCVKYGVNLDEIERHLDLRSRKITRRPGLLKENLRLDEHLPAQFEIREFDIKDVDKNLLIQRPLKNFTDLSAVVEPIVHDVKLHGDEAVKRYTEKFDKVSMNKLVYHFPFDSLDQGQNMLAEDVKCAIDHAYQNIYKFHDIQMDSTALKIETSPGVECMRFPKAIQSVGLYVPGGSAVLPSTALMLGIPAQVAGCKTIVIACPPNSDGTVAPEIVYIARLVKATHILVAGGAQAVAALTYGTETCPKVDKICGPGNQFVTAAKLIVQSDPLALVAIDMPAGPSEVLVVADYYANAEFVASDLLSQAEHGPDSQVVLVALPKAPVAEIQRQLKLQAEKLPRKSIIAKSLLNSFILRVETLEEALEFSNSYAPEHLILHVCDPQDVLPMVDNAGSVFLGPWTPESCGDYASGTNHTLPTYGYAKCYSGVSTSTFMKYITAQEITREGLEGLGKTVATLAGVEELEAHRQAVLIRCRSVRR